MIYRLLSVGCKEEEALPIASTATTIFVECSVLRWRRPSLNRSSRPPKTPWMVNPRRWEKEEETLTIGSLSRNTKTSCIVTNSRKATTRRRRTTRLRRGPPTSPLASSLTPSRPTHRGSTTTQHPRDTLTRSRRMLRSSITTQDPQDTLNQPNITQNPPSIPSQAQLSIQALPSNPLLTLLLTGT